MTELFTCRCGHDYDGNAQCFPCPAYYDYDYADTEEEEGPFTDGLPGDPYNYEGAEGDELDIEFRRLEALYDSDDDDELVEDIAHKKELCIELMEVLYDKREELGSGKYLELTNLIKNDLYDKLDPFAVRPIE